MSFPGSVILNFFQLANTLPLFFFIFEFSTHKCSIIFFEWPDYNLSFDVRSDQSAYNKSAHIIVKLFCTNKLTKTTRRTNAASQIDNWDTYKQQFQLGNKTFRVKFFVGNTYSNPAIFLPDFVNPEITANLLTYCCPLLRLKAFELILIKMYFSIEFLL